MTINLKELFAVSEDMNDKVVLKLLTAIKDGQIKDFDYLKFKQSYKSLIGMGMDENTAAKSAFVTASTMGLTKEKLLNTVQHYKNILAKEREEFALALKHQITTNVDAKTLEVLKLKDRQAANIKKIAQIEQEQVIINQEISKLEETAIVSQQKINETRDQFKHTFDVIFSEIEEDGTLYDNNL